jgi:hypothetical protein
MQQVLQAENAEATELLAREGLLLSFSIEVAYAVYKFRSQRTAATSVVSGW